MITRLKANFKKILFFLLGVGVVSAAPLLFPGTTEENKNDIAPLTFNGQIINFPYTDDNTGETLIIKTDQQTYSSWDSAYVHFAVKNITNDDQDTKIQFAYDGGANTSKIEEFKPQVPYQVEVPDYADNTYECKEGWEEYNPGEFPFGNQYTCKGDVKTARYCSSVDKTTCTVLQEQTGSHLETRYKDEWGEITKAVVEDLKSKDVKPIDSKFVPKEQVGYWIPAGATKYFRAKLIFSPKSNGEFYINAYGHLNAAGHLDPWYSSSWGYRRQITLDYTKVGTTTPITGIPLMFSTSTITDLRFTGSGGKVGKSDGTDILVTASDGTTKIPHELEFYSSSTGETVLWFKSSTSTPISTSTNTGYYLYYGNSGASDQQDAANVWDSNFKGVWHLGNGTTLSALDSSTNDADGTITGSTAIAGKVDGGANFDGNDKIETAINKYDNMSNGFTFEAWVKYPNFTNFQRTITITNSANTGFSAWLQASQTTGKIQLGSVSNNYKTANTSLSADTWYHVVGYTNYTQAGTKIYINGVDDGGVFTNTPTYTADLGVLQIGALKNSGSDLYGTGVYDEIRVSDISRSADWIKTEYNNQSSPNTFWSVGSEEQDTPAAASTSRRIIIIE